MSIFHILFILGFNVLSDLILIQIQIMVVLGVKEPILNIVILLYGEKCEPVRRYTQHQVEYQRLLSLVLSKLFEHQLKLPPVFGVQEEITVLEGSCMSQILKLCMALKYGKLFKFFQAGFVINPFEVPFPYIFGSPRPLIWQMLFCLDLKQEFFHLNLKPPKRRAGLDIKFAFASIQVIQETERVEGGVISTQIHRILLVALALMNVVCGMESMFNELLYLFIGRDLDWEVSYRGNY